MPDDELSGTGLFDPRGGYSEPDEYIPALLRKNRELGVDVLEQQTVTGFLQRGGRVTGVRTNVAEFEGDAVIATVYSWNQQLMSRLGLRLPVKAFVHQRYVTRPLRKPPPIPGHQCRLYPQLHIRPARGDRLLRSGITPLPERESEFPKSPRSTGTCRGCRQPAGLPERDGHGVLQADCSSRLLAEGRREETEKVGLLTWTSMDADPAFSARWQNSSPGLYLGLAFTNIPGFAYNPVAGSLPCMAGIRGGQGRPA